MLFRSDNKPTGIDAAVTGEKGSRVVKFVKGNRVVIEKNGVRYNAMGQRI